MQRIIIKHISGSKANQVDTFPVAQFQTLTLGRGTAQTIKYDPDWDDTVSREHAKISWDTKQNDRFLLTDLNSSNGTYVNKRRIDGTVSLSPGDTIQLGPGGPEFHFDVDPRPEDFVLTKSDVAEAWFRPTREAAVRNGSRAAGTPAKAALGRETVERIIGGYHRRSRQTLVRLAVIVVGLIVVFGSILLYRDRFMARQLLQTREEMAQTTQTFVKINEEMIQRGSPADPTLSPTEIVEKFGQATVIIEMGWNLIHAESGAQVYHRYEGGGRYPAYIKWQGKYHPWLYIDDDNNTNIPIGGAGQGSGFVVTNTGYILTSRHLAASWYTRYGEFSLLAPSVFFDADEATGLIQWRVNATPITDRYALQERQQHLEHWVPAQEDILVKTRMINGKKTYYVVPGRQFTGRLYKLDVMFPKNKLRVPAQLASTSTAHDVALLKIHMPNAVPKVTMHDSYKDMLPGTPVTILGYPHGSPHVDTVKTSTAPFSGPETAMGIPGLTATPGFIGQLIREDAFIAGVGGGDRMSALGDGFQLSVQAIDRGNRGGPVFDQRGRVIGIFNYDVADRVQTSTVVPIRFGMEIMGVTPGLE